MKRFIVPIGLILYVLALIFYTPPKTSPSSLKGLSSYTSDLAIVDYQMVLDTTDYSVYNESPCVDTALSIISILERHNLLDESIQVAVSDNHVQVIKFNNGEMEFFKLDDSMSVIYDKNEFPEIKKLKFFSINDFKMATIILPPTFSLGMLTAVVNNFNKPKISFVEGDYIEPKR